MSVSPICQKNDSMIYWVVAFVVLVALIGGAMWLATASGTVAINWLDYDVSVPIGFALGAVLLVILSSSKVFGVSPFAQKFATKIIP